MNIKLEEIKNINRFNQTLRREKITKTLDILMKKVKKLHDLCVDGNSFISSHTVNKKYYTIDNLNWTKEKFADNWTNGFWSGILWYSYLYSNNKEFYDMAKQNSKSFRQRAYNYFHGKADICDLDHHDIGFLYLPSTKADYQITGDLEALDTTLKSADILMNRYLDRAKIIQAWGSIDDPSQQGRMIIDCNLNIPLLYFAYKHTKNEKYKIAADNHYHTAIKYLIRDDASTFHTYFMDIDNGLPKFGKTFQGKSDDSSWARGQAWGIYGFMLGYKYLKEDEFLDKSIKLANYFLNRLPDDLVCNWDLIYLDNNYQKDTSAAAIACLGMLEINKHYKDDTYKKIVMSITNSLIDNYLSKGDGFLDSGVYHHSINLGVDESLNFGDFFFLELLLRLLNNSETFW